MLFYLIFLFKGGAADSILDFFKNFHIKLYKEIEYVGIEISENLCSETEQFLKTNHSNIYNNGQITVINASMFDFETVMGKIDDSCYILCFDFIDSLPYDRIKIDNKFEVLLEKEFENMLLTNNLQLNRGNISKIFELYQTKLLNEKIFKSNLIQHSRIELNSNKMGVPGNTLGASGAMSQNVAEKGTFQEKFYSIENEPEIKEILSYYLFPDKGLIMGDEFINMENSRTDQYQDWFVRLLTSFYKKYIGNGYVWLPTKLPKFFDVLNRNFPNHSLIIYDFDFLNSNIFNDSYLIILTQ